MSIENLGTSLSEKKIKTRNFSFTKMHLKLSSAKLRPFCPGGDELKHSPIWWTLRPHSPGQLYPNRGTPYKRLNKMGIVLRISTVVINLQGVSWISMKPKQSFSIIFSNMQDSNILISSYEGLINLPDFDWGYWYIEAEIKGPPFFQTTFSNAFSWMKSFVFGFKFHWRLFLMVQMTVSEHWFT